jgi:hypothetical protein
MKSLALASVLLVASGDFTPPETAFENAVSDLRRGAIYYGYACHAAGFTLQKCVDMLENALKEAPIDRR